MQNAKKLLAITFLFMGLVSRGQDQAIVQNYINTYKAVAIAEMQRSGIPASITLAQGIHETLAGTSDLVIKSNNHFGIKCKDSWKGESVSHDDDARGECFRKYSSSEDSYRDHSDFLAGSPRYASLFKLDPLNYSAWAYGLKKAGYATNPKYPVILIRLIEDYHLQDYTLIAMGKKPAEDGIFAKADASTNENKIIPAVAVNGERENGPTADEAVDSKKSQYPEGEFKINDTRVVFAEKGSSFLSIADKHSISLSRLFDFNDLSETEILAKDQLIYLQRKRKTGANDFHTVNAGETLYDIAQEEGIRMESLLEYNLLEKNMQPAAGQRLYLKTKASERPALAIGNANPRVPASSSVEEKKLIAYRVQPKETIYAISKKYNVKIDDLVLWNQLTSYNLKTGQQLRIYK
ncbi:MAG TPA: glucosaminidase domain-containing protein [Chitinophagaceae bacterium]|nr:glucosaminidase domain-containing protein [Chitinophagaceae bacterium]